MTTSSDLRTRLEQTFGATYAIERELGGGGMARVFVAVETALDRRVVVKVMSPELAAGVSQQRFAREIRLAASLQQANIVPVLSTGEIAADDDGGALPYYVMPFVDGESLHHQLSKGPLGIAQAIGVLRDVARALAYAHERGVVHRDIKPGNVLLSGDSAVVTDFGIAKAIAAAQGGSNRPERAESAKDPSTAMTGLGIALGTPAYMSPEQVIADPAADHRADLYSFGCLAYEVFAGTSPFTGRSASQLLAAHVTERPAPLGEKCPDCPVPVARMVMRCLEKNPNDRPQSAREILQALDGVTAPATGLARLRNRLTRRQRTVALLVAGVVVAMAGAAWLRAWLSARVSSIAVIPFYNAASDSAQEYLSEGISDELATALGKVPGIRIGARTASRQYKGRRDADAHTIGAALGTSHVLQGSFRQTSGRLHMSVQLTSARDNGEIWSETYDRSAADALAIQDSIVRAIGTRLRGRAADSRLASPAAMSGTANVDAQDLYMRGKYLLQRRGRGVREAIELFEQALAKDSNYARARASLAFAVELLPNFEQVNKDSVRSRALREARRALARDSNLAEAHTALAMLQQEYFQWPLAEESYRRAVVAGADEPDVHIQYGRFLFYTGRMADALRQFQLARRLDPASAVASGWVGHLLELGGQDAAAMVELRRALLIDSTNPPSLYFIAQAHLQAGRRAEARAYFDRLLRVWPAWRGPAVGLLAQLDTQAARGFIRDAEAGRPGAQQWADNAGVWAAIRDSTRLFESLDRATKPGESFPANSLSERHFDFVRRSARFAAIVRKMGLDERVFTSANGGRDLGTGRGR